ncbi:MAG TPA: cyclic nucleotide-binding domain-containing protein [Chloroflexota bacterium]|nr:cyclic nucleotide-binding domain-containing protein [Chloroflexota bacterium]
MQEVAAVGQQVLSKGFPDRHAEIENRLAVLSRVPLFGGMPAEVLRRLAEQLLERSCAAAEIICRHGDAGDCMYFIGSGKVVVTLPGEGGRDVILAEIGQAEFFGEMSLLDGQPRSASVTALEPTSLLALGRDDFLGFLSDHRQALNNLLVTLSLRLREADQRIQAMAKQTAQSALAASSSAS